jgi:hypothetical protein
VVSDDFPDAFTAYVRQPDLPNIAPVDIDTTGYVVTCVAYVRALDRSTVGYAEQGHIDWRVHERVAGVLRVSLGG